MGVPKRRKGLSAAKTAEGRWRTVRRKGGRGGGVSLPPALAIRAGAAARATGQTFAEFVAEWVASGIEAARESGGVPLTRHERAALDRLARREAAG